MANTDGTLVLGGAWLASQGIASCRRAALLALELGFSGVLPAPTARRFPWHELRTETEDLPFSMPAIRVARPFEDAGQASLASSRADDVLAVRERVERAAVLGRAIGVNVLVLEAPPLGLKLAQEERDEIATALSVGRAPDPELRTRAMAAIEGRRDAGLEHACRNLHALLRQHPDFRFCLTESSDLGSLSGLDALEAILDDLASTRRLAYWHRASVVAWHGRSGGPEHGAVLECLSKYLRGMDLEDYGEHGPRSVPGSGLVDYGVLQPYSGRASERLACCLEPDPACRPDELRHGRALLEKFDL